jgi:hypothetical protein
MKNQSTKRIRVPLYANSKEANSRIADTTRHFVGGLHYSVQIRSSVPEDHNRLLEIVQQANPSGAMAADRLLRELAECEARLLDWIERSPTNAQWFANDPLRALSAANVGITGQTSEQLLALSSALAGSVKGGN